VCFSLGIVEIIISKDVGVPEHVACMKNLMAGNLERKMSSGRIRNGLVDNIKKCILYRHCATTQIELNWINFC
jgi:hypothetical protein